MTATTTLLPFQPATMTPAQLAAVSFLARYSGHTHVAYAYQLRRWFEWCETNGLDPLIGIQRGHVELYIHQLGESGRQPWRKGDWYAEARWYPTDAQIRAELAGRDLACWCPLDQPCHADVLLEIANGDTA